MSQSTGQSTGMRFDGRIAVLVAVAGCAERPATLAAFFADNPWIGPRERRDIRGALAARITWTSEAVGDRPAFTIRRADAAASAARSAA